MGVILKMKLREVVFIVVIATTVKCCITQNKAEENCTRAERQSRISSTNEDANVMSKFPDPISSHVLDTASGLPASGISILFEKLNNTNQLWEFVVRKETNADGRASAFLTWEQFEPGTYKMKFDIKEYFERKNSETFYPYAEIVFEIKDPKSHYHVPLLLSPFGYTTYR